MTMPFKEFFTEYGEAHQYEIQEVVGKGSYGVVASAVDTHTGKKVAIKKINNVFEHVSEATRILREIKLLRLLRHPDIVEIKHILLPPCPREFKDIYVVFELMECDLQHVIKANGSLSPEHYQFFLYQLLRGLKYMHTANVFHRDLKPKNILANADCKLKLCDFGLARAAFGDTPSAIFWTDYVATRWYRAPELCGSFYSKYTPAVDMWSIGCIFAEMLTKQPLFPGDDVVHQLDLITDLLGSPSTEVISRIKNDKARIHLSSMTKKAPVPLSQKFPDIDPLALRLLESLIAFDPKDRPSAEEALAHPYFRGLANIEHEPSARPISKFEFDFERRKLTKEDITELIYREILEYHPQMLQEYLHGTEHTSFLYPSGVDCFKEQFDLLEGDGRNITHHPRRYTSLPRERVYVSIDEETDQHDDFERHVETVVAHKRLLSQRGSDEVNKADSSNENEGHSQNELSPTSNTARCLIRSASISFSKCVGAVWDDCEDTTYKRYDNGISRSSKEPATLYA
ncbi:mitogen-activated protein kinase 17 [Solanum stenotomum]|uniref:mitogen-activated protein kinase 17 n=1 Tax=Solanum stenotomum TaxID=172797 RepID=UPI0020D12A09|nr:mitogen-activated protein kinase 17 [Solanum stenotomum]XP_049404043.1 mitogen-activated protein kinase 17 [Solanum stenotomum]